MDDKLTDVVIYTTLISVLFGLLGYFVHRWVSGLDDSIKELRGEVVDLKLKVASTTSGVEDIKVGNTNNGVNVIEGLEKIDAKITFQNEKIDNLNKKISENDNALARYGTLLREIVKRITKEKAP